MVRRWLPSIVWMSVIFYSSAQQGPSDFPVPDYVSHFVVYSILGALYYWALLGSPVAARGRLLVAVLLTATYGWSDEFHQSFISGRESSLVDLAVDVFAALSVLSAWELARRGRPGPAAAGATDDPP